MAWIESHQELERHPKTLFMMNRMGWDVDTTLGKLHRFWWWCVDYCEDGDLRRFNDSQLGCVVGIHDQQQAARFVKEMVEACWLDRIPGTFRVHAWWRYIGRFLQVKYHSQPAKWQRIRAIYLDDCGNNGSKTGFNNGCLTGGESGCLSNIPKPLPLNYKEGGKGTIPRAGAEETGRLTTDTGHRTGKDEAKTPPVFASHGGEKQDGHRTTEAGHQVPVGKPAGGGQTGPRKFVNEIIRQKKELQAELLRMQHAYPDYSKMPKDKEVIYQEIKKKMRQLDKELLEA